MTDAEKCFSVWDAAEVFSRSLSVVRQWCIDGEFPGAHYGSNHAWRIPVGEVEAFKKRREAKAAFVYSEGTEARRERDRARKRAKAQSMKIGHRIPGLQGQGSRAKKEQAIAVTVVKRRCDDCQQVFEGMVKDWVCPHCGYTGPIVGEEDLSE